MVVPVRAASSLLALVIVLVSSTFASSLPTEDTTPALAADADHALRAGAAVPLLLGGSSYRLEAAPHRILAADAQGETASSVRTTTYVGTILGSDLRARLSLDPERRGVEGLVLASDGTGWLLLPRPDGGADAVSTVGLGRHGAGEGDGRAVPDPSPTEPSGAAQEGTLKLRLAIEADHIYWKLRQGDWAERILEIVSYTELIYATQLDVVFEVTHLEAWQEPDPYTARHACWSAVDPGEEGKLEQFAAYWHTDRPDVVRDTAHLFTGTFGEGRFTGCAYIGALAGPYAYGVSLAKVSVYTRREVALWDNINLFAHELGHNFGGVHEKSVGLYGLTGNSAYYGLPPHTIMDTGWNGILRFSDLDGVHSPGTGWELDNAGAMRAHAADRLRPA